MTKNIRKLLLLGLLLVIAITMGFVRFSGVGATGADVGPESLLGDPEPAPEFTIHTLDGAELASDALKGEVVVLDFWATWCAPCLAEIPHYNELQKEFEGSGFKFLGITVESGNAALVREFVSQPVPIGGEEYSFEYPIYMGNDEVADAYGPLWGYPTTFLIDSNWQIRKRWIGAPVQKPAELHLLIEHLLGQRPGSTESTDAEPTGADATGG